MIKMKEILSIQHTESIHHTNGMIGSWTDWDLSEKGIKEAHNIGKKLGSELTGEWVIYSSDLKRAKQTAEIIGSYIKVELILVKELRERHLGEAIGKSTKWASENSKGVSFRLDFKPFDGSESIRDHYFRVEPFLDRVVHEEKRNIILVSHGGTNTVISAKLMKFNAEQLNQVMTFTSSGSVSRYLIDDEGIMRVYSLGNNSYKQD